MFDEIFTAKHCEFFRSNGTIYGMSNPSKKYTALSDSWVFPQVSGCSSSGSINGNGFS